MSTGGGEKKSGKGGVLGCSIIAVLVLLVVVVPILWSMWSEGLIDGTDESVETAPVFGPRDAGRLVERLSAASAAQGVCYGWVIESGRTRAIPKVTPSYSGTPAPMPTRPSSPAPTETGPSVIEREMIETELEELNDPGVEYGSNLGVGIDPRQRPQQCPKWVVLTADYTYDRTGQYWSNGYLSVDTSSDLELNRYNLSSVYVDALGQSTRSGPDDDYDNFFGPHAIARLADAISALPLMVAEEGLAPPPPVAPGAEGTAQGAPPGDTLPRSSLARPIFTGVGIVLIAGGVVWIAVAAVRKRRSTTS
ncbi:hypothetical protein Acsp03_45140 [Actinomadura sp. NBRC 104412]|uniref:hypothetical protein n=1 Tax=Actinomadura sp. NBRC 104412 TaxID=3032203 RepID=UPI0024A2B2F2|nr:hypothetical protein [Actinomadura sp. NBRC 104412]GLZ07048.1 hypothetical protein Acsp03_45140 [Actinomadura sp. NBRC 104412]